MMSIRFRQFWLVLLLALVLPAKGVMAITGSMCHVPDPVGAPAASHAHHPAVQASDDADAPGLRIDFASHHQALPAQDTSAAAGASCLACASSCGAFALPAGGSPAIAADAPGREWSALSPSAPHSHISAGLERPPRSI